MPSLSSSHHGPGRVIPAWLASNQTSHTMLYVIIPTLLLCWFMDKTDTSK